MQSLLTGQTEIFNVYVPMNIIRKNGSVIFHAYRQIMSQCGFVAPQCRFCSCGNAPCIGLLLFFGPGVNHTVAITRAEAKSPLSSIYVRADYSSPAQNCIDYYIVEMQFSGQIPLHRACPHPPAYTLAKSCDS